MYITPKRTCITIYIFNQNRKDLFILLKWICKLDSVHMSLFLSLSSDEFPIKLGDGQERGGYQNPPLSKGEHNVGILAVPDNSSLNVPAVFSMLPNACELFCRGTVAVFIAIILFFFPPLPPPPPPPPPSFCHSFTSFLLLFDLFHSLPFSFPFSLPPSPHSLLRFSIPPLPPSLPISSRTFSFSPSLFPSFLFSQSVN